MTHFGILCPAKTGQLNTMLPLERELQQRRREYCGFFGYSLYYSMQCFATQFNAQVKLEEQVTLWNLLYLRKSLF